MAARRASPAAHLIVGEDSFLRTRRREEIIATHVPPEGRAFSVAQFSLRRTALAAVLSQARVHPMLSSSQVLVMGEAEALDEKDLAQLEEYWRGAADFTVLIFEAEKLDRRTRAARFLFDRCQVYAADSPDDSDTLQAAQGYARELGLELTPETAEELVFVLGNDQGVLHSELAKLRAYRGREGPVTTEDLAAVITLARKFSVFELADLLVDRRRAEALARLRRLLEAGENPIGIVALLAWLYRQLWQARSLPRNTPPGRAAQLLRAPRSRVEGLLRQARKFSPEEFRRAFAALLETDVALKSSPPNAAAVLEVLVVRLTRGSELTTRP